MKKIFSEKVFALGLIFIAFVVAFYFYQRGEISFLSRKRETTIDRAFETQIPIGDKEYKISYRNKTDYAFNIAGFEENENWYGDGEFDYCTFYEGQSSLFLTSFQGQKSTITLKKKFDIEDVLNFKFIVYLATDFNNLEEFNLIFTGRSLSYEFPIRDIKEGWNFLVLSKGNFSTFTLDGRKTGSFLEDKNETVIQSGVEKIVIELVSRPKTRSIVNLDCLWAEKDEVYLADWNADSDKFLSVKENEGLLAVGKFGQRATLKKGSAKNYTFQAKFTPLTTGEFGLFLRSDYKSGHGYYLAMGGVGTDAWRIYKYGPFEEKVQSLDLHKGKIGNFKMEKDQAYWLKAETKEDRLVFYFSTGGKDFIKLGEARDDSFASGGIGFATSGDTMFFIDDIQFFQ